jgi:hypothetical protein
MAHHSDKAFDQAQKRLLEQLMKDHARDEQLGATGQYPQGKLVGHDEGELSFGVTNYEGKVILNFNTSVHWLGMDPDQARLLARSLMSHATKAEDR